MAHTFRLLRAGGDPVLGSSAALGAFHPVVTFSDLEVAEGGGSFYSIIIGNNGSGKSRLLGAIASEFAHIHRSPAARDRRTARIGLLDYVADDVRVAWEHPPSAKGPYPAALPTRVIAVALTPVDKFPLEPSGDPDKISGGEIAELRDDVSFYHYVGMRDRTNRASISALLYRALEGLGRFRSAAETARLRRVFEMLGYKPHIKARLKTALTIDVQAYLKGDRDLGNRQTEDSRLLVRLRSLVGSGPYPEDWLRDKLSEVTRLSAVDLNLHFGDDHPHQSFDAEAFRLLRRLGALTLTSVEVCRADGARHDLREASSGEISILTVFLSVAAHLRDGSLVLIDEPETSLHPEWQSKYVHLMREVFSGYPGCHFIFSTHSPHIVADVPHGSWIYSMDRASSVSSEELLGRSPDYVMARAFDVINPTNYYLRDVLANALRLVGDRQINTVEFADQLTELVRLAENMEGGARVKQIVKDLLAAKAELSPDAH